MQAYKFFISLVLILDIYYCAAQNLPVNEYGLTVLLDKHEFLETTRKDSIKQMVELKKLIPNIRYELRYATKNNFMKRKMYPGNTANTFLRLPAARSLKAVQEELNAKGLGLKIWDAYRPYSVTEQFWKLVKLKKKLIQVMSLICPRFQKEEHFLLARLEIVLVF